MSKGKDDRGKLYCAMLRKFQRYSKIKLSLSEMTTLKAFMEFQDYLKGKIKHWRTG